MWGQIVYMGYCAVNATRESIADIVIYRNHVIGV